MFKNMFFVEFKRGLGVPGGVSGAGDRCDSKSNFRDVYRLSLIQQIAEG